MWEEFYVIWHMSMSDSILIMHYTYEKDALNFCNIKLAYFRQFFTKFLYLEEYHNIIEYNKIRSIIPQYWYTKNIRKQNTKKYE
jgi:hypothetical protein